MMRQVVAFSGGKDSTATALLMAEAGEDFSLLFTPTGNELLELNIHIHRVRDRLGCDLIIPENKSLAWWIKEFDALPNFRQRWCTRLIKIEPCIAWLKRHPGSVLCVGLRVDEPEREGLYGDYATYRYPLREAGMDIDAVIALCRAHGLLPEFRTDCAVCPYQRLGQFYELWRDYPDHWAEGEAWEQGTGHTFRSAQRDSWPAAMKDLRARFEAGDVPKASLDRMAREACRVCRL